MGQRRESVIATRLWMISSAALVAAVIFGTVGPMASATLASPSTTIRTGMTFPPQDWPTDPGPNAAEPDTVVHRIAPRCMWDPDGWGGPYPVDREFRTAQFPATSGFDEAVAAARAAGQETVWSGLRLCDGTGQRWFVPGSVDGPNPPAPTVGELLPGVILELSRIVPAPVSAVNPPTGIVNFGMWLAAEPLAPIAVRVEDSGVWAQATATPTSITFEMGSGDIVSCDGLGDPIRPDVMDSVEQSPVCGYTYLVPSPTEAGFDVTITVNWDVRHTGSNGLDEAGAPLATSTTFAYPVFEIQTVGATP